MTNEGSSFEQSYTKKVNTIGFLFLLAHLPVLCVLAASNGTGLVLTAGMMLVILAAPALILWGDRSSKLAAVAMGVASMGVSALTIYVCGGQIEAHFEIFVLIAMLAVFGRIAPLLAAGSTIALHHVIFWLWLPSSVFNYKAGFGIVLVHAFFVVLEIVPVCWIATQFGRSIKAEGLVMDHLGSAVDQIDSATSQIAASSQSLAHGATEQAASIEETSASASMIKAVSMRNADAAQSAVTLVEASSSRSKATDVSLTGMVEAMDRIGSDSQQISKVVKTIDQIAFQTNILALNTAVEAARAGEAGLGFAVVADEVRTLAQRSAQAAKESEMLISASIENARLGIQKVNEVAQSVRGMISESSEMMTLVSEINSSSREQSRGIDEIATTIQKMEGVTQSNAASAEQTAAAVEELSMQAKGLKDIVQDLAALSGLPSDNSSLQVGSRSKNGFRGLRTVTPAI